MAIALSVAPPLCSQISSRVFHVWVDPIYGDDAAALARNPSPAGPAKPLQAHRWSSFNIRGHLQHAPYSFRTVTAALSWIQPMIPTSQGISPEWVWRNTDPDSGEAIRSFVIHCLPGLYGPKLQAPPGQEEFDPRSGLPWNGETFPLVLPPWVGLQGTSALDTIFDARGGAGLVHIRRVSQAVASGHWSRVFVDSIALRGCRAVVFPPALPAFPSGAAIAIEGSSDNGAPQFTPTVSNCFIYGNDVGIALIAQPVLDLVSGAPLIANNTFAWNHVGIVREGAGIPEEIHPTIHNNIFDPVMPTLGLAPYLSGVGAALSVPPSCFEGVADGSLTWTPSCLGTTVNPNAYHRQLRNLSTQFYASAVGGLPVVSQPTPPVVDLTSFGTPGLGRGEFFIADFQLSMPVSQWARHDLRLAPMVRHLGQTDFVVNPVVNQGFRRSGLFEYQAGFTDDLAVFSPWDWDAEGFGNPREASRRNSPPSNDPITFFAEPIQCAGRIDLGADELGELIVAGYLDSTRIFSSPHAVAPQTSTLPVATTLWFFNVSTDPLGVTAYESPQLNWRQDLSTFTPPVWPPNPPHPGSRPEWFAQIGASQNPFTFEPPPFNFTHGMHTGPLCGDPVNAFGMTRRSLLTETLFNSSVLSVSACPSLLYVTILGGVKSYPFFLRNRVCDFSPHLIEDIRRDSMLGPRPADYAEHDFLDTLPPMGLPGTIRDAFRANPWFDAEHDADQPGRNENRFLYGDRSPTTTKHLRSGTVAPPLTIFGDDPIHAGTFPSGDPRSFLYRDAAHPIVPWNSITFTYSVGADGTGQGGGVPLIPGMDWYGVRVNLELPLPSHPYWDSPLPFDLRNNLQTFLVVNGQSDSGASRAGGESNPLLLSEAERADAMRRCERYLQELSERRRRGQ